MGVTAVVTFLPLQELASSSAVCRSWCSATRDDGLWESVVGRQWLFAGPGTLGVHLPGGWREICRCFCTLKLFEWQPLPNVDQQTALANMAQPARRFLFGIAHGYVPTSDGLFTYHGHGATPIHYRHNAEGDPDMCHWGCSLRLGGTWTWSADREVWFATDSCDITSGTFGSGGWRLVADNMDIVNFLHRWPLIPLIAAEITLQSPYKVTDHYKLNEGPHRDMLQAIGTGPRPTTSCISINAFTVHFHFLPALLLTCNEQRWQVARSMSSKVASGRVVEFEILTHALHLRRAGTDFVGVHGRPLPPLYDFIYQYERYFRLTVLGLPAHDEDAVRRNL